MKLHELTYTEGSRKDRKRIGRGHGSGQGKTAGKGHKGQNARSGGGVRLGFEGGQMPLYRRLPKFGFTSKMAMTTAEVRLSELSQIEGDVVSIETLKAANLIRRDMKRARVMLSGEVTKAYTFKGIKVTKGAKLAIEAAGGSIEE